MTFQNHKLCHVRFLPVFPSSGCSSDTAFCDKGFWQAWQSLCLLTQPHTSRAAENLTALTLLEMCCCLVRLPAVTSQMHTWNKTGDGFLELAMKPSSPEQWRQGWIFINVISLEAERRAVTCYLKAIFQHLAPLLHSLVWGQWIKVLSQRPKSKGLCTTLPSGRADCKIRLQAWEGFCGRKTGTPIPPTRSNPCSTNWLQEESVWKNSSLSVCHQRSKTVCQWTEMLHC